MKETKRLRTPGLKEATGRAGPAPWSHQRERRGFDRKKGVCNRSKMATKPIGKKKEEKKERKTNAASHLPSRGPSKGETLHTVGKKGGVL